jgi:N-methylhydantoinase B
VLQRADGTAQILSSKASDVPLGPEDIISVQTPGSGGYGDPAERERSLVLRDLAEAKVSVESAVRDYGIILDSTGHSEANAAG